MRLLSVVLRAMYVQPLTTRFQSILPHTLPHTAVKQAVITRQLRLWKPNLHKILVGPSRNTDRFFSRAFIFWTVRPLANLITELRKKYSLAQFNGPSPLLVDQRSSCIIHVTGKPLSILRCKYRDEDAEANLLLPLKEAERRHKLMSSQTNRTVRR